MNLSTSASRFDNTVSWMAAIGNEASLRIFDVYGAVGIHRRNSDLLRLTLSDIGWAPVDLPQANRSTIVSVPLPGAHPAAVVAELRRQGVVCAARDGNLRFAVHLCNHEDDVQQLVVASAAKRFATSDIRDRRRIKRIVKPSGVQLVRTGHLRPVGTRRSF